MKSHRKTDPSHVQSVERALLLLELIGKRDEGTPLSRLSADSGLTSSTAHRLLTTMSASGFVQFDSRSNSWAVGRKAFQVGMSFAHRKNLVLPALPIMRRLREETNETINFGVRAEDDIVTLAQVESRHVMRAVSVIGGLTPLMNCALGKAILATFPNDAIRHLAKRHAMPSYTAHSIRSTKALLEDIEAVRLRGFAIDDGEFMVNVRCVAVPVFDPLGDAVGGLSISALTARVDAARFQELGQAALRAGLQLTQTLGGTVRHPLGPENSKVKNKE